MTVMERIQQRKSGKSLCPVHSENTPSLHVGFKDGRVLLHCFGCNAPASDIVQALGLEMSDLFTDSNRNGVRGNGTHAKAQHKLIATYDYTDESGVLLFQVCRFEPKDFVQRRPDGGGGWIWKLGNTRRVLYRLHEVLQAEDIFVVEGEKDVNAVRSLGFTATCNPVGAGNWRAEYVDSFKPHQRVVVIPDNDEPGKKHAQQIAESLYGKIASIKIIELPDLPPKGDVSDWLASRDPEAAAEELARLAEAAPEWTPTTEEKPSEPEIHVWELHDLADVEKWEAEPLVWKIQNLIADGDIGFLSGAPKDGKTLLTLDQIVHIAHVKPWLQTFATMRSQILYIAREDPMRRLKERLTEINKSYGYDPIPHDRVHFLIRERFRLTETKHIDWLFEQTRTREFDFVVLDVLNRMIPELDEMNAKDMAHMVDILERLNRELHLTIQCLDHTRKPSGGKGSGRDEQTPNPFDLKGSVAKYGAADFMLCLSRTSQPNRLQLYCESKDNDVHPHFLIDVSPKDSGKPKFTFAGHVDKLASDRKAVGDANRQKVLRALSAQWESAAVLAVKAELKESATRSHLNALLASGHAQRDGKTRYVRWRLFAEPFAEPEIPLGESN